MYISQKDNLQKNITLPYPISFCCPIYNESRILLSQAKLLSKKLKQLAGTKKFEIIIINNGSTDIDNNLIRKLKALHISYYTIDKKGHGLGLKMGIQKAKYDHVVLSAIDLPFSFSDINNVVPYWSTYDIIFGSKSHPKSLVSTTISRKISSVFFRRLLHFLFEIPVSDTQGSVFLRKKKIVPLLPFCNAENAFFTAQLAIYAKHYNLAITEVPVILEKKYQRKSKYNIIKDGSDLLQSIFKEYRKIKLQHNKFKLNYLRKN